MSRAAALVFVVLLVAVSPATAGQSAFTARELAGLSFRQHPGAHLPLDTPLVDEAGHAVRLGDFFHGKPAVLVLDYLRCRTLCGFVLGDLARAVARQPLHPGGDFTILALSIDPRDGPEDGRAARARYAARFGAADAAGWHFLTGTDKAVRAIADTVGFPYRYDADAGQYAHPAGLTILAPDATIARYILGVGYPPLDLRLALTEAAHGKISSPVADLLLLCYCYDPTTGRYDLLIGNIMRVAGTLTVLGILALLFLLNRARRRSSIPARPLVREEGDKNMGRA